MRSQIFCLTVNGTSQEPTFRRLQVEMFLQFLLNIVCAHRSPIWTSMSSFAMCTVHLCYANFKGIKGAASIGRERSCLYSLPQWRSPPLSTVASMSTHPCAVRLQFLFLFIYLFKCMKSFKSKWREWSHFFIFFRTFMLEWNNYRTWWKMGSRGALEKTCGSHFCDRPHCKLRQGWENLKINGATKKMCSSCIKGGPAIRYNSRFSNSARIRVCNKMKSRMYPCFWQISNSSGTSSELSTVRVKKKIAVCVRDWCYSVFFVCNLSWLKTWQIGLNSAFYYTWTASHSWPNLVLA